MPHPEFRRRRQSRKRRSPRKAAEYLDLQRRVSGRWEVHDGAIVGGQDGPRLRNPLRQEDDWGFGGWLMTDAEFGIRVVRDAVHVHDLQATILHLLGIDHERLTFRYQGRDFRLTDVKGRVVREILA
jgi:hypothetical protein